MIKRMSGIDWQLNFFQPKEIEKKKKRKLTVTNCSSEKCFVGSEIILVPRATRSFLMSQWLGGSGDEDGQKSTRRTCAD